MRLNIHLPPAMQGLIALPEVALHLLRPRVGRHLVSVAPWQLPKLAEALWGAIKDRAREAGALLPAATSPFA